MKRLLFFFIISAISSNVFGQLDTQFFCPPLNDYQDGPNQLVISTSFPSANVTVRSPNNTALPPTNYTVVAGTPLIINYTTVIPAFQAVIGNIQNTLRNTVLSDAGLIITSDVPVAVYLKPNRGNNQEIIPLKGTTGLGTIFRAGSQTLPRQPGCGDDLEQNSHFISVMASEDNTTVTFNNPNPGGFQGTTNPVSFTLNTGQSVMVQTPQGAFNNQISGTLVTSNNPISVTSGGQHIGAAAPAGACDAGIDNLVPIEEIGTEYIFARGNGNVSNANQDYAFVVAHSNNTQVFVNGVSQGTINAGQVLNYITPQVPFGTPFYLTTSNPAYVYHVSSRGGNEMGMSILPRLTCTGNRFINFPRQTDLTNGVYVIIQTASIPSFLFNGQGIAFYGVTPIPVPTLPQWSVLNFGDATILANNVMTADESFHVGLLGNAGTSTGLYGFLSSYNVDIQAFNPQDNSPSNAYIINDVCINEAFLDTLLIRSCAPPHQIDSFQISPSIAGLVQVETSAGPNNPVYSFLANSGFYSGPVAITFFITNTLGHQTQVTTNFIINAPPEILVGFPVLSCFDSTSYQISANFTGVPPFVATGDGAPGVWVGNSWTSAPIPLSQSFSIVITDNNGCNPPFDLAGNAPAGITNAGIIADSQVLCSGEIPAAFTSIMPATTDASTLGIVCNSVSDFSPSIIESNLMVNANSSPGFLNNGDNANGAWMASTDHFMVIDLGQVYQVGTQVRINWFYNSPSPANRRTFVTSQIPGGNYLFVGGINPFTINVPQTGSASTASFVYTLNVTTQFIQIDMTQRQGGRVEIREVIIEQACVEDIVPAEITYQWQISTDGGSNWVNIPGAISEDYLHGALTQNSQFRRLSFGGNCPQAAVSNVVSVEIITNDLSIIKTVNNINPEVGDNIVFTLTVNNIGACENTGVVVSDLLPTGFTYVSHTGFGTYTPATGLWNIGNMNANASVSLEITATVNTTGDYINIATVNGNLPDPIVSNNISGVQVVPNCTIRNLMPNIGN